jgi:hypothetical protein
MSTGRDAGTGKAATWCWTLLTVAGILPLAAAAQSIYHDPKGRYQVEVPAGWSAAPDDDGIDEFTIRRGASQAIVLVIEQNPTQPMTAERFVGEAVAEFQQQCPTFRERQSGAVSLAGNQAAYELVTCSDANSPAVAETEAVLRKDKVLIGFTMIAPLKRYVADLPVLDGIRNSLRVPGQNDAKVQPPDSDPLQVVEAKRECAVGALPGDECARQIGIAYGKDTAAAAANVYHDPTGRFSFIIPSGWTAVAEGDKGLRGVQLRAGANWINVMPAASAGTVSDVVLRYEQEMAAHAGTGRTPPFGTIGLLQLFGHGTELTYDNFSAKAADGSERDSYVGGVGTASGNAGDGHLLMVASVRPESDGGKAFLTVGQSVRFGSP